MLFLNDFPTSFQLKKRSFLFLCLAGAEVLLVGEAVDSERFHTAVGGLGKVVAIKEKGN
jgi:hypothetical protein